jgi:hypothetical protein
MAKRPNVLNNLSDYTKSNEKEEMPPGISSFSFDFVTIHCRYVWQNMNVVVYMMKGLLSR